QIPQGPQGTGLRPELRILIASALSIIVILLWAKFFAPKPQERPSQTNAPAASAPANTGASGTQSSAATTGSAATSPAATMAPVPPAAVVGDKTERKIVVESDLYRIEFSNRGGVVKSWRLKKYMDDAKPQQVLDVVHEKDSQEIGGWPLSVTL